MIEPNDGALQGTGEIDLVSRFQAIRDETERLSAPLSPEDQVVQSMADASPTKWHRAHTTWFFETFLLEPNVAGHRAFDPSFGFLFNSYYESVGARHPRPQRGMLTRPSVSEVAAYRRVIDDAMCHLIEERAGEDEGLCALVELGLHHEQQHQELLLMDIKHAFACNPLRPAYASTPFRESDVADAEPTHQEWIKFDGGVAPIGHAGAGFAFDNEGPAHEFLLQPFRLGRRLVTCGEWLDFIADGGYRKPTLWLSDGWHTVQREGWEAPAYWRRAESDSDEWRVFTLRGETALRPQEPVVHLSYYEADAFARWAGARLPTEFEWESAARAVEPVGNLLPDGELHPVAAPAGEIVQLFGDVWEWTSSAYQPYPGFRPSAGAVGEYNGKFMVDQQVLRGGCAVTPGGHIRATYRNFYPARSRWIFGGLRLGGDS